MGTSVDVGEVAPEHADMGCSVWDIHPQASNTRESGETTILPKLKPCWLALGCGTKRIKF